MSEKNEKKTETYKDGPRISAVPIVGIGASAGGLEALQSLLSELPSTLDFSYVIIQHLSPDYKSLLTEILAKFTPMPVIQAEDNMPALPNRVYVIPPRKSITVRSGILHLVEHQTGGLHLPIDTFFHSLAEDAGRNAIGVILSGTGSDGTNGIRSIKEADGVIIAQSPASCKFDGMPKSAIRTGLVDVQGTPEEIVAELEHISDIAHKGAFGEEKTETEVDDALMTRIYFILKKVSGVNFTHYKKATILRRLERRMMLAHMNTLPEYVDLLYAVPDEAKTLSKEVLIGVTNFFREPEYFALLKEKVITQIIAGRPETEPVRVWVAGCSTGEEAYSIAILFCEVMDELKIRRDVKIFATDLDTEAIVTAGKGVYGANIAANVSAARLSRYFTRKGQNYIVNRDVRKMLIFAPHNVIQDPPFSKLDLISCRNLMIYFQPILQKDLFSIFHAALRDGGFLFLGKSEAVGSYTEVFPVVDAAAKIFSHRSDVRIKGAKSIPYLQTMIEDYGSSEEIDGDKRENYAKTPVSEQDPQYAINIALLERFMPACIVVSAKNELVYVYGDCRNFISFPVGKMTSALFDIIAESLRIPVSTALKESRDNLKTVQYTNIHYSEGDVSKAINLTVMPISKEISGMSGLFALVFDEVVEKNEIDGAVPYDVDHMAAQRIANLEQELAQLHLRLSDSIAEQETVNEELQASNEELLTANEELQSSNEELQSVNEELYTVNSEYQLKVTQLAELNDDMTNFLATTLIGIIFVDSDLCIRRYTNYATTEFNIMDQDIGRPIDTISYQFVDLDIAESCRNVIATLTPDEREVETIRGKAFLLRVAPFRTTENKILGCVITIVDITAQRKEQEKLRSAEDMLTMAQKANAAKSDFLSRMSHEIRTPMNTVAGLTEMIESHIDDKQTLVETAKNLRETVKYMTSIVSDILEMSKIERSQIELDAKPFSMPELIKHIITMTKPRMEENGLTFSTSFAPELESFYIGDPTRIQQIIMNILTNAMKYTPRGGNISFKAYEKTSVGNISEICFIVSDDGEGIKKELLNDIFSPFKLDKPEDAAMSNMGLGLTIAESFAKLMGGGIAVESTTGHGSTFTVTIKIPMLSRKSITETVMSEHEKYDLAGCNVLVAEDNPMNRTIMEELLRHNGVTFRSATDGDIAVEMFKSSEPYTFDCILMDMRMPNLNGADASVQIRKSGKPDAKTVPIVAISANAFSEDLDVARSAGMDEYLTKPLDTRKLFETMEKYWKRSRERKKRLAENEKK